MKLAASQLGSIAIGRAQTYLFPVERDAVGSVNFADDPAIIQAESTLLAAAASLDLTRKELNRVRSLGKNNGIAEKELDQATSDEQTADAALRAARDGVRALGKTDAQIDHMIKSGRIEAASGHAESKWVIANAVELDSPLLHAGQMPKSRCWHFPIARSKARSARSIPPSTRIPIASHCESRWPIPPTSFAPECCQMCRSRWTSPNTSIGIPANGVVREGDGTMTVWVTSDRTNFYQRTVKTGLREGGLVQILQGLQPGESVVTNGAIFLDNLLQAPPSD